MDTNEQVVFYKTLVRRGISIFPAPAEMRDNGIEFVANKVLTTIDNRVHIDGNSKVKGFADEAAAIDFIATFINWKFENTNQTIEAPIELEVPNCYFKALMLVDLGFGPQNVDLGNLVSGCQEESWYDQLMVAAEGLAAKYFQANYPDRKTDTIKRSVKVQPIHSNE